MAKRQSISDDFKSQMDEELPIDTFLPPAKGREHKDAKKKPQAKEHPTEVKSVKDRLTIQIDAGIIDRVKDAVYWTPGLTIAQLVEESLALAIDKLEKKNGQPFQKRKSELKPGRPLK